MSRVVSTHFGGILDDIKAIISKPSTITIQQQTAVPTAPVTDSFFVKNSGLVITSIVALAVTGTLGILYFKNRKKA